MSENGEIYTAGNKFYTAAGSDGMDKFHLCWLVWSETSTEVPGDLGDKNSSTRQKSNEHRLLSPLQALQNYETANKERRFGRQ